MKVSLEKQGKNVVQLGLELPPERALKAYELACRQLSQKVNIPGFRKGKAPRKVIEKTLGVDYIKREALEHLVPELLQEAITHENLDVITQPEVDSYDFELGQALKLSAKFEVRPEVVVGVYNGISVQVTEAKMPADALEKAMQSIAQARASLTPIDGRPIAMGDTVSVDFECFVDGSLVEGGKAQGLVLEIKEGNFLEGFCEQLVGKEPGAHTQVKVKFPDNYRSKELAGKEATFEVDLRELKEWSVPALDDELAKSVGQESLAQLEAVVEQQIAHEIVQENETRAQRAVVDAVIASAKVDIPDTMIERECNLLMGQLKQMAERDGQDWEAFLKSDEYQEARELKLKEAGQRVLTSLVLGAIVRQEKMAVTDEETAPYLVELAQRYNVSLERVIENDQLRRQVTEEVLTQKVVEYLVGQSNISYVPKEGQPTEKVEAVLQPQKGS